MAYGAKAYTLREESTESGTRYFISFKDGQGNTMNWKCQRIFSLSFGRWNGKTGTFSNGTSGTGSLIRCGTKPFTDGRCECLRALMNKCLRRTE